LVFVAIIQCNFIGTQFVAALPAITQGNNQLTCMPDLIISSCFNIYIIPSVDLCPLYLLYFLNI